MAQDQQFVLAALDFGSTYSGYAYTFRSEYRRDKTKLYTNRWDAEGVNQPTFKAPTVVLFDKDKRFHSFGYKAESHYARLAENGQHIGWRYFRFFKMKLYEKDKTTLHRKIRLIDDQGKRMLATEVFSASIRCLADHLIETLNMRAASTISINDVEWLITVPAIWTDGAKQFMQLAATQAGLPDQHVSLALEPEAAAVYISQTGMERRHTEGVGDELRPFDVRTRFMVIDLGGGTVDMTFHEVTADDRVNQIPTPERVNSVIYSRTSQQFNDHSTNSEPSHNPSLSQWSEGETTLAEIHAPEGGQWGGNLVNEDIEEFMREIFTEIVWDKFSRDPTYKEIHLDLMRAIESAKRGMDLSSEYVNITVPPGLMELFQEQHEIAFKNYLQGHAELGKMVSIRTGKFRVTKNKMAKMFDRSLSRLLQSLTELIETTDVRQINTMVLVGGFSESRVVQAAIRERFPDRRIVIPEEASLAVLKGAVMYGYNNHVIRSRIMKHTYGICVAKEFDERNHPQKFKVINNKGIRCENIFEVMIPAGTVVYPNQTKVTRQFNGSYNVLSTEAEVSIYISPETTPFFVTDEGCVQVGSVEFSLERECVNSEDRMVDVTFFFGHTRITVAVREQATRNVIESRFNCLN